MNSKMSKTNQQDLIRDVNYSLQIKDIKKAVSVVSKLNNKFPRFAHGWYLSSFVYYQYKDFHKAKIGLKNACRLEPNNHDFLFQGMMLFKEMNEMSTALFYAKKISELNVKNTQMAEKVAMFLLTNFLFVDAKRLYDKLLIKNSNNIEWLSQSALIEQALGNIEKSVDITKKALHLNPKHANTAFFFSHLTKKNSIENNIPNLIKKLEQFRGDDVNSAMIYFSIAKELEDCKQYEDSFKYRKMGADIYRSTYSYDINNDIKLLNKIEHEFTRDYLNKKEYENPSNGPIFIVGLPRSGTSLLERIVTSHVGISAGDEMTYFSQGVLNELKRLNIKLLNDEDAVAASKIINTKRLGSQYLKNAKFVNNNLACFTDKYPENIYYIALILKSLKDSKVLILERHPMAVCYSVYKQMFHGKSYPYSYDLIEMAKYYAAHNKLVNHWVSEFPERVRLVKYENLVVDLEKESKSIMKFLGHSWDNKCLSFHKNPQAISSASSSQVRKKLYTDSLEMWRNYKKQLKPLSEQLIKEGIDIDSYWNDEDKK